MYIYIADFMCEFVHVRIVIYKSILLSKKEQKIHVRLQFRERKALRCSGVRTIRCVLKGMKDK